jgi:hypothetical protein
MDREQLLNLLANLESNELAVKADGTILDDGNNEFSPEDVESAIEELTADLTALLEWAKAAPKREQVTA